MVKKKFKKKRKDFFKNNYNQSWNYIRESKNFIYAVVILFAVFCFIGFFIPVPEILENQIMTFIEELLNKTENMSQIELTNYIFFNNLQGSFFGLFFGIVFGIFSVMSVVANGYLLGFVASMAVKEGGIFILWRILPHGVFELPALFISLGLGLKLGTFVFQEKKIESLKKYLLNSFKVFLFIVIPLLIIAALIEGGLISLLS